MARYPTRVEYIETSPCAVHAALRLAHEPYRPHLRPWRPYRHHCKALASTS